MSDFVLDASVVVSLYLPATSVQRAYAVKTLELMRNGTVAAVPGLFDLEIGSALIKARLLGNLLVGSIPAVIVGAMLSARLPHALLRAALAVVLLMIGVKLW